MQLRRHLAKCRKAADREAAVNDCASRYAHIASFTETELPARLPRGNFKLFPETQIQELCRRGCKRVKEAFTLRFEDAAPDEPGNGCLWSEACAIYHLSTRASNEAGRRRWWV